MPRGIYVGVLAILFACTVRSQTARTLNGTVLDQDGAFVRGATVTLKQLDQSSQVSTLTDTRGAFRFEKLSPASYDLSVSRDGFNSTTIRVSTLDRSIAVLNITLTVADVQQEVSIAASANQANTEADGNLDVVKLDRNALSNLPALDQNYIGALSRFLDSGAVGTGGVSLVVDGMEATKVGLSPSAIQEIRINNNPYSAEYSRPGKGRIEIITKPGSAQFHGEFNFLFRDQLFNARDAFATVRPAEQRRIYEGNFSGPVSRSSTHPTTFLLSVDREEENLQSIIFAEGPDGPIRSTFARPARKTEFSLRLTRQMTKNSVLSLLYSVEQDDVSNQGVGGFNLPELATISKNHEDLLRFNHNWIISPRLVSQVNILFGRYDAPIKSVNAAPRIVVQDAFSGGGAQADYLRTEAHWTLNQMLTYSRGRHTLKGGVQVPDYSRRGINDRTNSAGTFYFASLNDYLQKKPFSFVQQQGLTKVTFWEVVVGGFVQDELRLKPNLTLAVGLRYDRQNRFNNDNNNFGPRVSMAWSPAKNGKTVIRGGVGFFYDKTGAVPLAEVLRFDGQRLRRLVLTNPSFPDPFITGQPLVTQPTSVVRLDPFAVIPVILQASGTIERQLQKSLSLSVGYNFTRGINSFRSRDANAPLSPVFGERPDPRFSLIRQIESTGRSNVHSLDVSLRGNVTRYFNGMIQYVWARAWNDTGGINSFPADSNDLRGEWARADFDMRHRFNLLGTFRAGRFFNLGAALTMNTGTPYTLTTGRDDNRDSMALDRPHGVARNTLQGPGFAQLDLRWSREFHLNRKKKDDGTSVTLGVNALNVTNRVNFAGYVGNLSSPFFGQAVAARPSRRVQFTFQFAF